MTVAFMPSLSGYRDAFAFVVLVLVLLVRPTGLFGQRSEGKDMKTSMRNLLLNLAAIGCWPCSLSGRRPTSTATRSRSSISSP